MNTYDALWRKLSKSKQYREEFVAAHVKRAIPHQARALMKAKNLSQQQLAERAGLTQGVVSRAVNPSYGNLTLNTIIRIAAGFDVAFVGQFVPFSELAKWYADLPTTDFNVPSFDEECTSGKKMAVSPETDKPYHKAQQEATAQAILSTAAYSRFTLSSLGARLARIIANTPDYGSIAQAAASSRVLPNIVHQEKAGQALLPDSKLRAFMPKSQDPRQAKIQAQNPPDLAA